MKNLNTLFLLLIFQVTVFAQTSKTTDYEQWPEYMVAFQHLELELEWDGFDELTGTAAYRIKPYFDGTTQILLHAPNQNISAVSLQGNPVQITHESDTLIIHTDQLDLSASQEYSLVINYSTRPQFGFIYGADDVARTSFLPKSVRHWLPGFDHPRTRLTTQLDITVPAGYVVAATGFQVRSQDSGGKITWRYSSESPVSLSELAWAAGYLSTEEAMFGNKRVRVFYDGDVQPAQILEKTIASIRAAERLFNLEFPGRELNLVVRGDDFWETKSFGSQLGFVYTENASVDEYISRAVLGQWLGVLWNSEQQADSEILGLIQFLIAEELEQQFSYSGLYRFNDLQVMSHRYQVYDPNRNADWHSISEDKLVKTVQDNFPQILQLNPGIIEWRDVAGILYRSSGKAWKSPVMPAEIDRDKVVEMLMKSTVDAPNNRIVLEFSEGRALDLMVTVLTTEGKRSYEVSVSGEGDRIPVPVPGRVQAIIPGSAAHADVHIVEEKSMTLWLNQLRADELTPAQRIQAARGIGELDDDPDLQLLLRDVLNRVEDDEKITAEIYRTLGNVTKGATGVERLFLTGLRSERELIRNESLLALRFYRGNEEIKEAVFSIISGSDDIDFVNLAIPVYGKLIEEDDYQTFIGQFLNEDADLEFTRTLLDELFMLSDKDFVIERGQAFLSNRYPFDIRYQAFHHLKEYDDSRTRWRERQDNLSADADARMRHMILRFAAEDGHSELLKNRLQKEYDARVAELIESKL